MAAMGGGPCFGFLPPPRRGCPSQFPRPVLTIGGGDFRGVVAAIRMACELAGVEYTDVRYATEEDPSGRWTSAAWLAHRPPLEAVCPLAALPYVVNHTTGEVVSHLVPIFLHLTRALEPEGRGAEERAASRQAIEFLGEAWDGYVGLVCPPPGTSGGVLCFGDALTRYLGVELPARYGQLEEWLVSRGVPFLSAASPGAADVLAWELLDQHEALAARHGRASPLCGHRHLAALHGSVRALPALRRYFSGPAHCLPMQCKMSLFS